MTSPRHVFGVVHGYVGSTSPRRASGLLRRPLTPPHSSAPHSTPPTPRSVAVIGAGAGGLVTARELLRRGHHVTIFERLSSPGGVWIYHNDNDDHDHDQDHDQDHGHPGSDPSDPPTSAPHPHAVVYASLRTNLPRELMGYLDFPFTPDVMGSKSVDPRRFPTHAEVRAYLDAYAERHALHRHWSLETEVLAVEPVDLHPRAERGWIVDVRHGGGSDDVTSATPTTSTSASATSRRRKGPPSAASSRYHFDALAICNGHFTTPRYPPEVDHSAFPGLVQHSRTYRTPDPYRGRHVLVVGAASSGEDIARELAGAGVRVTHSAHSWQIPAAVSTSSDSTAAASESDATESHAAAGGSGTVPDLISLDLTRCAMVERLDAEGTAWLSDGTRVAGVDVVLYCTGYHYDFPFLTPAARKCLDVTNVDNHVSPLYLDVFPVPCASRCAMIGLPWKVVPFPQMQLQAALYARILDGTVHVPEEEDMRAEVAHRAARREEAGRPVRHAHMQGDEMWAYNARLAGLAGLPAWGGEDRGGWRGDMYRATGSNKRGHPETYRDTWTDEGPRAAAAEEFAAWAREEVWGEIEAVSER